jgi:hypothetical protein
MALPILERSYQFAVNHWSSEQASTTEEKDRSIMFWMKNTVVGWTSSPWTVYQSSDGTAAGTEGDGVDRWLDEGDLVWNNPGTSHSWIVFDMPVGSGQICWDLQSPTRNALFIFSPEGLFTGGTVTNRPTAVDEVVTVDQEWLDGSYTAPFRTVGHMLASTDGKMCMFLSTRKGHACTFWCFFEAGAPEPGWDLPYAFCRLDAQDDDQITTRNLTRYSAGMYGGGKKAPTGDAGLTFTWVFCTEGSEGALVIGDDSQNPGRNRISRKFQLFPLLLGTWDTGARGVKGYLPDVYITGQAANNCSTIEADPTNPTREWAVFGCLVVPWDGSVPLGG